MTFNSAVVVTTEKPGMFKGTRGTLSATFNSAVVVTTEKPLSLCCRHARGATFNSAVVVTTEKPAPYPRTDCDEVPLQFGRGRDHGETDE